MKTNLYSIEGKVLKQVELPEVFSTEYREDLIKRAVLSEESKLYQPKGAYRFAGLETSARYRGRKEDFGAVKNKGIARLPHEVLPKGQLGKVKRIPQAVKGRRAHPPKPQEVIVEEMNNKEYMKALASAIATTSNKILVNNRNHGAIDSPFILENSFEKMKKVKEVIKLFEHLKLFSLVEKSKEKSKSISGVRHRSKKSHVPKSVLIVVSDGQFKAAGNLSGVDVVSAKDLQVRHLAPGTHAGRTTIFTESALNQINVRFLNAEHSRSANERFKVSI
ncbi:50S ribosomal protein L4 [Candidatus Micrarchaeota archaeon]|nr:50S ribosomal protein L4 [Candidatus Micrarchaeota archaeon]